MIYVFQWITMIGYLRAFIVLGDYYAEAAHYIGLTERFK